MNNNIKIRNGCKSQLQQYVDLFIRAMKHSPTYHKLPIELYVVTHNISDFISHPDKFIYVAEHEDQVVGGIIGQKYPMLFNNSYEAMHNFLYVDPQYRSLKLFKMLLAKYIQWCDAHDVTNILVGHSYGGRIDQMDKLYSRFGLTKIGSIFKC